MNAANLLTTSRFFLSFLVVYLMLKYSGAHTHWALFVFLIASLTDYWDGRLARKMNTKTVYGALMDPIADKALTLCTFLGFWKLNLVPGLWIAVIATRDVLITAFRLFSVGSGRDQSAGSSGKQKTFLQMTYIIGVLLYLSARQRGSWDPAWEEHAIVWVHAGMLILVGLALSSGLDAFRKSRAL